MDSTPEDRPRNPGMTPSESGHAGMIRSRPAGGDRPLIPPGRTRPDPASRPGLGRHRGIPADSIVVDPSLPGIREYLRRATLDGLIRTAPANVGKVCIIPVPRHPEPGDGEI